MIKTSDDFVACMQLSYASPLLGLAWWIKYTPIRAITSIEAGETVTFQRPQLSCELRESHAFRAQVTLTHIAINFSHKQEFEAEINNKNCNNFNNDILMTNDKE